MIFAIWQQCNEFALRKRLLIPYKQYNKQDMGLGKHDMDNWVGMVILLEPLVL